MCVGSAKKRASLGLWVEAFFCLDFLFLFHLRKKKTEKKITALLPIFLKNDTFYNH
jgi:hypothetical protein